MINVENSDSCCHGNNIVVTGLRLLELLAMLPTKVGVVIVGWVWSLLCECVYRLDSILGL